MRGNKILIAVALCLVSYNVSSQQKNIEYSEQTWVGYFNQTRFTDKLGIWADLHWRLSEEFINENALGIARLGLTYYINDHVRATAGYAYAYHFSHTSGSPSYPEHRPWQQIQWMEKKTWLSLMQWVRLEERFRRRIEEGELTSAYNFNYRVRYNMAFTIPLKGKQVAAKVPFIFINDEVHINFGDEIVTNYFDQNRLFVGLGYQFTSHLNAHVGYMHVFQQLNQPNSFRSIDAIRLFVFHNLDFRTKE